MSDISEHDVQTLEDDFWGKRVTFRQCRLCGLAGEEMSAPCVPRPRLPQPLFALPAAAQISDKPKHGWGE